MASARPAAIALLDLDGTLIDGRYNLTVPEAALQAAVADVADAGALVGISSDSSLERIARFAVAHGFAGPLVGERGAVWAPSAGELAAARTSVAAASIFSSARDRFAASCRAAGALVEVGDVNRRSRDMIGAPAEPGFDRAVLVNGERRGSLGFYALVADGGTWRLDAGFLATMRDEAMAAVAELDPALAATVDVDFNEAYGVVILHAPGTGKSLAVPELRARFGDVPLFIVGDSDADWHHAPRVVHCAVANAAPAFLAAADFVAPSPIAAGAVESLGWIAARLRADSLTRPPADPSVGAGTSQANV